MSNIKNAMPEPTGDRPFMPTPQDLQQQIDELSFRIADMEHNVTKTTAMLENLIQLMGKVVVNNENREQQ